LIVDWSYEMGLLDVFKKDADTLYFSFDELPNPRNTAIFSIRHGKTAIASSHLTLDDAGLDKACRVIDYHRATIALCSYKKIAYENLTERVQSRLAAALVQLN
jgi:hypothetical protein